MKKISIVFGSLALMGAMLTSCEEAPKYEQPTLEARKVQIIEKDGYQFKDLNKNGELDAYEDWRLPMQDRINDLVSQMTLEEKIGLMFHPNIAVPADGKVVYDAQAALSQEAYAGPIGPGGNNQGAMGQGQMRVGADVKTFIEQRHFRNILNNGIAEPKLFAQWSNTMQEYAEASRLGIPIMFSSDPRHGATLGAHVSGKQYFSQWPSKEGQVGITAARDRDIVEKFGEAVAEEYRAVGLHMILGPQIDVITEPRWSRNMGCFSEDADLTIEMMEAFMEGAQGDNVGPDKVLVHLKHWPGANPHEGGKGNFTVYPGNNVDYHLKPFKAGIAKGALAIMGYYSGTYVDTLNVNYSPYWSTKVLYDQLGFKGSITSPTSTFFAILAVYSQFFHGHILVHEDCDVAFFIECSGFSIECITAGFEVSLGSVNVVDLNCDVAVCAFLLRFAHDFNEFGTEPALACFTDCTAEECCELFG